MANAFQYKKCKVMHIGAKKSKLYLLADGFRVVCDKSGKRSCCAGGQLDERANPVCGSSEEGQFHARDH